MIALVVVFLVACYVLKIFFPEQFVMAIENETLINIGNFIDNNPWLLGMFGFILSMTTDYLFFGAVCKRKWLGWKLLIIMAIYNISIELMYGLVPIEIIDKYAILISAVSSCYMIFLPMFFTKTIKELSITYTINYVSQALSLSIRDFGLLLTNVNTITMFIFSFESYLWLILLFLYFNYKGDKKKWEELNHFTETKTEQQQRLPKSTERLHLWNKIKQFIKNKLQRNNIKKFFRKAKLKIKDFIIDELWIYIIVIGSIVLCSWLFNRWIEGLMFCIAHIYIRKVFDKQFHFNSTAYCLTLTLAIIWFAIPITLPLATSLLSSMPIAFGICFIGYLVQDRVDLMLYKKKHEMFNLKTCTKEQLIEACNILGYNNEKQELAIMFFIDKLSNKDIWRKLCELKRNVEIETIKTYKYRMKQDFNSLIKTEE